MANLIIIKLSYKNVNTIQRKNVEPLSRWEKKNKCDY